jgi:hypothetical protein
MDRTYVEGQIRIFKRRIRPDAAWKGGELSVRNEVSANLRSASLWKLGALFLSVFSLT